MNIHFIGCEGASMKVLRRMTQAKGHTVTGSDIRLGGHNAANVENADVAVYTCAVGEDNCEVVRARERGIPVYERAEFLGIAAREYKNVIAVAGTHGKTTATGFCEQIFLPRNPTVHIGGTALGEDGRIGGNDYFICEACEYRRSFLYLQPDVAVILNAELDHTDYFRDFDDYFSAFRDFSRLSKRLAVNGDDPNCRKLARRGDITFGLGANNAVRAADIANTPDGHSFSVFVFGRNLGRAEIKIKGRHNIYNALAAVSAAGLCGLDFSEVENGLSEFGGVKRRFEFVGTHGGAKVYTDYAHHPSEIAATIDAARENFGGRLTVVFQPHTFSRTKSLENGFIDSLSAADRVIVAPVFAARENPVKGVSSQNLVRGIINSGTRAAYIDTFFGIAEYLHETVSDNETVIFVGAGDINTAAENFAE